MKTFAVFGNPIDHSLSPRLHNKALSDLNQDGLYTRVHLEDSSQIINKFKSLYLDGANVTLPHKQSALKLCDEASFIASKVGSVNTLVNKNNKIFGFNTDCGGFLKSIKPFGSIKNALVIGAGGSSRAVCYALKDIGVDVEILNRTKTKLIFFEDDFICYDWNEFMPKKYDLIVNTTSAGLKDENLCAPYELLRQTLQLANFSFDLIYGKKTPFISLCEELKVPNKDGLNMLVYQAVLSFNLFFDNAFNEDKIEKSMKEAFSL